jgi:serine/threonine-protein kinase
LVELAKVEHALGVEAEVRAAFLSEARAAARVHHVHFVQPVDTLSLDGDLFVATELTLGVRLDELWQAARVQHFEIPLAVNLRILLDVLAGVSALNAAAAGGASTRPLVHGDICPANIAISYRGDARLVHSGLASATSRVGLSGRRNGRLGYKAPEQLRVGVNAVPIGPGADVFAVGVMLWEALKGESPFDAPSDVDVVERICFGALPTLEPSESRFTHLALAPLVRAALERNPESRIPDARELGDAIERTHGVRAAAMEEVALAVDRVLGPTVEQRREQINEALDRIEQQRTASEKTILGADSHVRGARSTRAPTGYMVPRASMHGGPAASAASNSATPTSTPASHTMRVPPSVTSRASGPVASSLGGEVLPSPARRSSRRRGARVIGWAYALGFAVVILALGWMWKLDRQAASVEPGAATELAPPSPVVPAADPGAAPAAIAPSPREDTTVSERASETTPPSALSAKPTAPASPPPQEFKIPAPAAAIAPIHPAPAQATPAVAPVHPAPAIAPVRPAGPVSTASPAVKPAPKPPVRSNSDIPEEI